MLNISIWPIDRTLLGATTLSQSRSGNNGNKGVLCIPQSSIITGASPTDCSQCILQPQLIGLIYYLKEEQKVIWLFTSLITRVATKRLKISDKSDFKTRIWNLSPRLVACLLKSPIYPAILLIAEVCIVYENRIYKVWSKSIKTSCIYQDRKK